MGVNAALLSSDITKFLITSNTSGEKDIRRLVMEFTYEESVFDVSLRATATVLDAGAEPGGGNVSSVFDSLKLAGGEKVQIGFTDNYNNQYNLEMYIDEIIGLSNSTKVQQYTITMCSKELLMNESKRVRKKFEGKISESVGTILIRDLGTSKALNADETVNKFNFLGVGYKPFYWCLSLAKKAVPFKKGQVAGYLFFETYYGYNFKSVDELFKQEKKVKLIYTETTDQIPSGFDAKIIDYSFDSNIEFQKNLQMGTYNTETYDYNPYDQKYEENGFSVDDQEGGIKKAAKTNISKRVNPTFIESPSRYFNYIKDIGTLPAGSNLKEQLKKVDEPNLELTDTAAQAAMRYQQAFTIQLSITIAGNLGVNVGDMVYIEIPEVSAGNTPKAEKTNSGLYMISELCHKLTPSRTVSKLILVRDSYDK
jgi:hypothetical protein